MDEKLVEIVGGELVRAVGEWYGKPRGAWEKFYEFLGQRALANINDSGTHWVAPRVATKKMVSAALEADPGFDCQDDEPWLKAEYAAMRDAYLSEQEELASTEPASTN